MKQVRGVCRRLWNIRGAGVAPQVRIVAGPLVGEAIMRRRLTVTTSSSWEPATAVFLLNGDAGTLRGSDAPTPCDLFVCRSRKANDGRSIAYLAPKSLASADDLTGYPRRPRDVYRNLDPRISPSRKSSLIRKFVRQFTTSCRAALIAYFGIPRRLSAGRRGMDTLAYAIVAVIVINALFSFFQEYRAEQASVALHRLSQTASPCADQVSAAGYAREIVPGTYCCWARAIEFPPTPGSSRRRS
jgi:hypothetical protein